MTGTEIIDKFNLQIDDASELSDEEALDLANDIYKEIQDDRPWEWLKTPFSGSTSTTVPYIPLPDDFKMVSPNKYNESVVFVGSDFQEYKIVPFSERRDYRDQDGICYINIPNSRLYFTKQPTSVKTVEFDYIKVAEELLADTEPLYRGVDKIIMFGMAARFPSIEQADKGTSYSPENTRKYRDLLNDLAVEDANIKLAHS